MSPEKQNAAFAAGKSNFRFTDKLRPDTANGIRSFCRLLYSLRFFSKDFNYCSERLYLSLNILKSSINSPLSELLILCRYLWVSRV